VNKYKVFRGEHTQQAAAAKTGISVASALRVEAMTVLIPGRAPGSTSVLDPLQQRLRHAANLRRYRLDCSPLCS